MTGPGLPCPIVTLSIWITGTTPRELEVLTLLAKGFSNAEIGRIIGRTEGTVKVHVKNILQKLDVGDRTEAVTVAAERGFIRLG